MADKPPVEYTYQIGVSPNTPAARAAVTECLGWRFDRSEGGMSSFGLWLVATQHSIKSGQSFTLTLETEIKGQDLTVVITCEWP